LDSEDLPNDGTISLIAFVIGVIGLRDTNPLPISAGLAVGTPGRDHDALRE